MLDTGKPKMLNNIIVNIITGQILFQIEDEMRSYDDEQENHNSFRKPAEA